MPFLFFLIKTTLPLTHVFKTTLIIKTKIHRKLNKIKKTYTNNSIQNKTHPYVQNKNEREKKYNKTKKPNF